MIKLKYYLSALHNTDVLKLLTGKVNKSVKYLHFKSKKLLSSYLYFLGQMQRCQPLVFKFLSRIYYSPWRWIQQHYLIWCPAGVHSVEAFILNLNFFHINYIFIYWQKSNTFHSKFSGWKYRNIYEDFL